MKGTSTLGLGKRISSIRNDEFDLPPLPAVLDLAAAAARCRSKFSLISWSLEVIVGGEEVVLQAASEAAADPCGSMVDDGLELEKNKLNGGKCGFYYFDGVVRAKCFHFAGIGCSWQRTTPNLALLGLFWYEMSWLSLLNCIIGRLSPTTTTATTPSIRGLIARAIERNLLPIIAFPDRFKFLCDVPKLSEPYI